MNNVSNRVSERINLLTFSSLTIATIATSAAYLGSIFLLGESFLGFKFHATHEHLLILGLVALAMWFCLVLAKHAPNYVPAAMNVEVSILITLLLMIVVDTSYALIQNATILRSADGYDRARDSNFVVGEFVPKTYFPTDKNFRLGKPSIAVTASSFGTFYSSDMLDSPTLVNSTLERHTVSIAINELGFRETEPIDDARIFALGDSFTFGWGVNVDKAWVKQLEAQLSAPIYNLGLYDASPKQELELLKFLFKTSEHHIKIQHLLWMIYEGNDLEDSYNEMAPQPQPIALFSGTVFETLATLPYVIKKESVISKMLNGEIQFRYATKGVDSSHQFVDGIALAHPLFKSDQFGYKLFYRPYVDLVQKPMSYVLLHPNRPKLEKVFTEMGELARNFGFDVTVILAPSEGRLQGKYFAGFPKASDRPYFLDFVAGLARKEKFQIINLYDTLRPLADRRLLYFRDDDHWNEDGNLLVATSLSEELSKWSSQRASGR